MKRQQLEHILRASAAILGDAEFIVIGSQSILGAHPEADGPLATSLEADLYPINHPDRADVLSATIGEEHKRRVARMFETQRATVSQEKGQQAPPAR